MAAYTLTILDTMAIQNFIFGSNRLKENVGGSELVKRATQRWVYEHLPQPHNVNNGEIDPEARIEDGQLQAEVAYAGGGNTVILFAGFTEAKAFAGSLSEKLLTDAPGIELAVVHRTFDWGNDPLGGKKKGMMFEAFSELADIKRRQPINRPLAGLGVTTVCQSTGQVATTIDVHNGTVRPIAAEVEAKLNIAPEVNKAFDKALADSGFRIPIEFDEMGRSKDEASYIGVVHADGNDMSKRVQALAAKHSNASQNRDYIIALRQFSQQVTRASKIALDALIFKLVASITGVGTKDEKVMGIVPVRDKFVPLRPLVFGGDDLTFVCDGRLALTLTAFYLRTFEQAMEDAGLKDVHACAGIGVVKSHYPFARAYQLASELCDNAKKWVKDSGQDFSALDWHFAPGGIMGELTFIREREYQLSEGKTLLMRPIALDKDHGGWRHWSNFEQVIQAFLKDDWAKKRNKVKRLREALRAGEAGVRQFTAAYQETALPDIDVQARYTDVQNTGWAGEHCVYFDAIEGMDFFVPLYGEEGSQV